MKRLLLIGSVAALIVLPLWAQEKTKTEPKKTAEPKTTEPKTEPKKTEPKKTEKEPAKEKAPVGPTLRIEVYNLYNPAGVAVQPTTGDVFVSDSGHLRILRYALK